MVRIQQRACDSGIFPAPNRRPASGGSAVPETAQTLVGARVQRARVGRPGRRSAAAGTACNLSRRSIHDARTDALTLGTTNKSTWRKGAVDETKIPVSNVTSRECQNTWSPIRRKIGRKRKDPHPADGPARIAAAAAPPPPLLLVAWWQGWSLAVPRDTVESGIRTALERAAGGAWLLGHHVVVVTGL